MFACVYYCCNGVCRRVMLMENATLRAALRKHPLGHGQMSTGVRGALLDIDARLQWHGSPSGRAHR